MVKARAEFMRGEGAVLYTAVNERTLEVMALEPIKPAQQGLLSVARSAIVHQEVSESAASLYVALNALAGSHILGQSDKGFRRRFARRKDIKAGKKAGAFSAGFSDRDFAWHFSGALASAAVYAFVDDGKLSKEQAEELTLTDWGELISCGWFSQLAHSSAFTRNGLWRRFGDGSANYKRGALKEWLDSDGATPAELSPSVLVTNIKTEPEDGKSYLTASFSPAVRAYLRGRMHAYNSVGCPVARRVVRLPNGVIRANPHVRDLISRGVFRQSSDRQDGYGQLEQQSTAIDRTLLVIARQLAMYDRFYGTPVAVRDEGRTVRVEHRFVPPSGVLSWEEAKA